MNGWKRINQTELEKVYPGGVRLRIVNLTHELGKRHWNLGVVHANGVEWVESASTRLEIENAAEVVAETEVNRV